MGEDRLWAAAQGVRLDDAPRLGRIVRWRVPGTSAETTFRELFATYPFTVLDEGERHSVSGLCGRVWTLKRDYPEIASGQQFLDWREPGTVRVLFAHWIAPADGGAALVSESRVEAIGRRARWRMRALWSLVGRFERLIGAEALDAAIDDAGGPSR